MKVFICWIWVDVDVEDELGSNSSKKVNFVGSTVKELEEDELLIEDIELLELALEWLSRKDLAEIGRMEFEFADGVNGEEELISSTEGIWFESMRVCTCEPLLSVFV